MDTPWEIIFKAMPKGREVTCEDVFERARQSLPMDYTVRETRECLKYMVRHREIRRVGRLGGLALYKRR